MRSPCRDATPRAYGSSASGRGSAWRAPSASRAWTPARRSLCPSGVRRPAPASRPQRTRRVRAFNFAAGPATLPVEVLEQVREELTDWQGCGVSVMEVSHRGKAFIGVAQEAERLLRELLGVPAHYKVLFLQGGATGQFAAIPMNIARSEERRVG